MTKVNNGSLSLTSDFVSLALKGRTDGFDLKGGDATQGTLRTMCVMWQASLSHFLVAWCGVGYLLSSITSSAAAEVECARAIGTRVRGQTARLPAPAAAGTIATCPPGHSLSRRALPERPANSGAPSRVPTAAMADAFSAASPAAAETMTQQRSALTSPTMLRRKGAGSTCTRAPPIGSGRTRTGRSRALRLPRRSPARPSALGSPWAPALLLTRS